MRTLLNRWREERVRKAQAEHEELVRVAKVGEALNRIARDGHLAVLVEHVLDPMHAEAFQAFRRVDPKETSQVAQAQKYADAVEEITRRIDRLIAAGNSARERLVALAQEEA